jgi:CheY-like chemotaxis protein
VESELQANGRISILLLADNVLIRNLVSAALNGEGYCVLSAANNEEALVLSRTFLGRIQLLLSCLKNAGGADLAACLIREHPGLRVIGGSPKTIALLAQSAPSIVSQSLPPLPDTLAARIREALTDPNFPRGTVIV